MVTLYKVSQRAPTPSAELEIENDDKLQLYLPSSLRAEDLTALMNSETPFCRLLVTSETSLRIAELTDSLDAIRRTLRTKLKTKAFQVRNLRGQKANTRARAVLTSIDSRVSEQKKRYRRNYNALENLDPSGKWKSTFLVLTDQDVRMPLRDYGNESEASSDSQDDIPLPTNRKRKGGSLQQGQGDREESWIWELKQGQINDDGAADGACLYSIRMISKLIILQKFYVRYGCRPRPVPTDGLKK